MLEATQKEWKEQNKHYKKHGTMKGFSGLSDEEAEQMDSHITKYHYGQAPAPVWTLKNNFDMRACDDLKTFLDNFVHYYNHVRPAYALNHKSPIQYKTEQGF